VREAPQGRSSPSAINRAASMMLWFPAAHAVTCERKVAQRRRGGARRARWLWRVGGTSAWFGPLAPSRMAMCAPAILMRTCPKRAVLSRHPTAAQLYRPDQQRAHSVCWACYLGHEEG
jgi:hypothetical protein